MGADPPSTLAHLEILRADVRDEIKRRIEQRDKFSIQLTIALAAILAVAFSRPELTRVLIAAPLVSIYFTVLILYSYRVHGVLTTYLRGTLEPQIASTLGSAVDIELETYYAQHAVPGIRKTFFLAALWVVTISSLAYLFLTEFVGPFRYILVILGAVYLFACICLWWIFRK